MRRSVLVLPLFLIASALVAAPLEVASAPATSPDRQVLIVTANLKEGYPSGDDLSNRGDMKLFVRTLLGKVPFAPDVLLLQEVNGKSASFVARFLSRKVGDRYIAPVKPKTVVVNKTGYDVHTETAIVLNSDTMSKRSKGGYIGLTYERKHTEPGYEKNVRRQAHLMAKEKSSGVLIALMSIRFENRVVIRDSADWSYRYAWTKRVATFLKKRYERTANAMRAIGGDFNTGRCLSGNTPCKEAGWYKLITGDRFNYVDAHKRPGMWTGVDMIFARQSSPDAGLDTSSKAYSDHRFRWAIVSP